jgi:hypothetical protein
MTERSSQPWSIISKSSVSQAFDNRGPLHRRSAHMRTNFVKCPTPKRACKWIRQTLYRWLVLPQPHLLYTNWKHFLNYLLKCDKLWKELTRLLSVEGQPTKAASAHTHVYGCISHSLSVWWHLCNAFSSETECEPPATYRLQFEKHHHRECRGRAVCTPDSDLGGRLSREAFVFFLDISTKSQ